MLLLYSVILGCTLTIPIGLLTRDFLITSIAFIVGVSSGTFLAGDLLGVESNFFNALGGTFIGLIASFLFVFMGVMATDNPYNKEGKIVLNIMSIIALILPSIFSVVYYNDWAIDKSEKNVAVSFNSQKYSFIYPKLKN